MRRILLNDLGIDESSVAPKGYKFLGLSDGTLGIKGNDQEEIKPISGGGESIKFEAFENVSSGKIAQVLLDGKVREFSISDISEDGSFIDSLVLPDGRVLFLYAKEVEFLIEKDGMEYTEITTSVYSKILTIEDSEFIWTEESLIFDGQDETYNEQIYYLISGSPTISMIWDYKNEIVLVLPVGYNSEYLNNAFILLIDGDNVALDSRTLSIDNYPVSIISHPQLEKFIVSYMGDDGYYDYAPKVSIWDLNLLSDRGEESWVINEISSVSYGNSYFYYPLKLNYINGVVTVTPITNELR